MTTIAPRTLNQIDDLHAAILDLPTHLRSILTRDHPAAWEITGRVHAGHWTDLSILGDHMWAQVDALANDLATENGDLPSDQQLDQIDPDDEEN